MGNHNLRVRSLLQAHLKMTEKEEIAMIRHGARKPEHEFGQSPQNYYSTNWTPSPHATWQDSNTATKADRIRRERMPNFYRQWGGRADQALIHDDENNMGSGRQRQALEAAFAHGVAP